MHRALRRRASVPAKFLREHQRSCRTPAIQSTWSSRGHSATFPAVTGVDAEADVGMCVKLKELETAMGRFASGFVASLLSASQAEGVMERAARIEHMAATVKALAAERMSETELWSLGGDKTPAHMLARRTGESVSGAAQQLEAAKKLRDHPKTDAAARKGTLSPQQAAAITDAASVDPKAEDDLLDLAERASLGELRDEAARRKAAAEDQEETHKR